MTYEYIIIKLKFESNTIRRWQMSEENNIMHIGGVFTYYLFFISVLIITTYYGIRLNHIIVRCIGFIYCMVYKNNVIKWRYLPYFYKRRLTIENDRMCVLY